ncbi:MAG: hypothetical protein AAB267_02640 [Candidatus Desantisbacteria bacterium]
MTELQQLTITQKEGKEPFHIQGNKLGFDLLSFWQWAASDLVSNATRGIIAEYIIARALSLAEKGIRDEWAAFDLTTSSGIKVEVKSAAYVQSWHQKRLSTINFLTPKTRAWNVDTNTLSNEARRQADVYVFALLTHMDRSTIDPLNLDQWRFYVLPTAVLDARTRSQHSITLRSLEKLCHSPVTYAELSKAVEDAHKK